MKHRKQKPIADISPLPDPPMQDLPGVRYPPWDPKARLIMCIGCPYCRDDDPDVACDCPCHDEDRDEFDEDLTA